MSDKWQKDGKDWVADALGGTLYVMHITDREVKGFMPHLVLRNGFHNGQMTPGTDEVAWQITASQGLRALDRFSDTLRFTDIFKD